MDHQEKQHLIARQISDILSQSERIVNGARDIETLENFSKYSEEFKVFIRENSSNEMILDRVEKIPLINVKSYYRASFLSVILNGFFGAGIYLQKKMIIKRAVEGVKEAQGYYPSIQFLYKSERP